MTLAEPRRAAVSFAQVRSAPAGIHFGQDERRMGPGLFPRARYRALAAPG
jgi:hypothetical protein